MSIVTTAHRQRTTTRGERHLFINRLPDVIINSLVTELFRRKFDLL